MVSIVKYIHQMITFWIKGGMILKYMDQSTSTMFQLIKHHYESWSSFNVRYRNRLATGLSARSKRSGFLTIHAHQAGFKMVLVSGFSQVPYVYVITGINRKFMLI